VQDNRLVYEHNYFRTVTRIESAPLPAGDVTLGVDFDRVRRGPARVRLWAENDTIGEGIVERVSTMISSTGLDIGRSTAGVSDVFSAPFEFEGEIHQVEITTRRAVAAEDELAAEIRVALGTQ
jgi:hypothetical protein